MYVYIRKSEYGAVIPLTFGVESIKLCCIDKKIKPLIYSCYISTKVHNKSNS